MHNILESITPSHLTFTRDEWRLYLHRRRAIAQKQVARFDEIVDVNSGLLVEIDRLTAEVAKLKGDMKAQEVAMRRYRGKYGPGGTET